MASRTSRTNLVATFLTIAGVLIVAGVVLSFLPFIGGYFFFTYGLAELALGIALILLSGIVRHRIAKPLLLVGGIAWLVVPVAGLLAIGVLTVLAGLVAGVATLVAAILIVQNAILPRRSSIGLAVVGVTGLLYLLGLFGIVGFAFGVALLVTGILLRRDE